ncbi:STM4015 family protein [Nonomuraea sp. NN258]|nr:STM4015 family protein [Nonomuraea antri]
MLELCEYLEEYAGLPIEFWWPGEQPPVADPGAVAWRLQASRYDEMLHDDIADAIEEFVEQVDTTRVTAIVLGDWEHAGGDPATVAVDLLVAHAARFPALRSIFSGANTGEVMCPQSDITPLLAAFPRLERLDVRSGGGLRLDPVRHESLRALRIESTGLDARVVRAVAASEFPALEHLELWLGTDPRGGEATVADLEPILTGARLPELYHLGLQNSELQDEIAAAVAAAPVVARLGSLSLSLGALTDRGAEALLTGQPLTHLRELELSHNFLSLELVRRLTDALPGVEVDMSDRWPLVEDERYVAVGR